MPAQYFGRAERIEVVSDEHGFELHFTTNQGSAYINIQDVCGALLASAKDQIGNWIAEGEREAARHVMDDDSHSVHADIWDGRQR